MRAAKIAIILLVILTLMIWVRSGQDLGHLAKIVPFCSGNPPSLYDFAALALVLMCFLALCCLKHAHEDERGFQDHGNDPRDNRPPQP